MALIEIKDLHLHIDFTGLDQKANKILSQLLNLQNTMPTKADFEAAFARQSAALTNIADDIRRLTEQQSAGGLSAAEETEILNKLNAAADQLETLAGQTPEQTPNTDV